MRPANAQIDLAALRHNYQLARRLSGHKALAVIKADAYGHGAVRCAQALQDEADGFAVACIEEALELRGAGIRKPILLLEGFFEADELALIDVHDLWCVVQAEWQIDAIERAQPVRPLTIWLMLDSGMHRLGLNPQTYRANLQRLQALPQVRDVVEMTHFARADELDCTRTEQQLAAFDAARAASASVSLSNSAALLGWPAVHSDWARPGLMLYGASPFADEHPVANQLQAVMTVTSKVFSVRDVAVGEPVGYGAHFVARRPTRVGVVAMGYADGYPQFAPNGTPVAIDGQPGELIGRVSMDMLTIDLTNHHNAGIGSDVELWGSQVSINDLAAHANRSAYDVLCGLKRMPRNYIGA